MRVAPHLEKHVMDEVALVLIHHQPLGERTMLSVKVITTENREFIIQTERVLVDKDNGNVFACDDGMNNVFANLDADHIYVMNEQGRTVARYGQP
jgi:hypothetical protein